VLKIGGILNIIIAVAHIIGSLFLFGGLKNGKFYQITFLSIPSILPAG
jgi:hypothetical protein